MLLLYNDRTWHLPATLIGLQIVPLVKNKSGNVADKNNYRPVALANICSKVFELILLDRIDDYLGTTDDQFGFKKGMSTDKCIFMF